MGRWRWFVAAAWLVAACGVGCAESGRGTLGPGVDAGADADSAVNGEDARVPDPLDGGLAPSDSGPPPPPPPTALLEIWALDVWAQELPEADSKLAVECDGRPVDAVGFPVATLELRAATRCQIDLDSSFHEPLRVDVAYDGTGSPTGLTLTAAADASGHGKSLSHATRAVAGRSIPVHSVYLGLAHEWLSSAGRPARRGNEALLLMDGEEAWSNVRTDLLAARDQILLSTWWWESNFELVRDPVRHASLTPFERRSNTILGTLEASAAEKRIAVGQFWGQDSILSWITSDAALWRHAEAPADRFEFMGQGNETEGTFWFAPTPFAFGDRVRGSYPETSALSFAPEAEIRSTIPEHRVDLTAWPVGVSVQHASYHQKFVVVDSRVAYVGGMNLRRVDWDTNDHLVFDPRRMLYDATTSDRLAVAAGTRLPDTGPRKDYMVRIAGPSARDAADVFQQRWDALLAERAEYADRSTPFTPGARAAAVEDGVQVQITNTLPDPFWEHSIGETWFNAVRHANEYIFVEDQYFRIPMLVDEIVRRMTAVPTLRLVVVTKPVNEWTDPGCRWTYETATRLLAAFPTRMQLLQLRSFDTQVTWGIDETECRFMDVDTHSKLLIVDDVFASIGSANKNNRGIIYEAEMNVAIVDPAWVRAARRRILANMLAAGTPASDDPTTWYGQLQAAATWNDYVRANWTAEGDDISLDGRALPDRYDPLGFVYSLPVRAPSACAIESIGPDMV